MFEVIFEGNPYVVDGRTEAEAIENATKEFGMLWRNMREVEDQIIEYVPVACDVFAVYQSGKEQWILSDSSAERAEQRAQRLNETL